MSSTRTAGSGLGALLALLAAGLVGCTLETHEIAPPGGGEPDGDDGGDHGDGRDAETLGDGLQDVVPEGLEASDGGEAAESADPGDAPCETGLSLCGVRCVDPYTDDRNCGECDRICPVRTHCGHGACQCDSGGTWCDGTCADLQRDAANCGECGRVCDGGLRCRDGVCG